MADHLPDGQAVEQARNWLAHYGTNMYAGITPQLVRDLLALVETQQQQMAVMIESNGHIFDRAEQAEAALAIRTQERDEARGAMRAQDEREE